MGVLLSRACALVVVCAAGCALPYASVPARIDVGVGTALGRVPDRTGSEVNRRDPNLVSSFRAIGHPLSAIPPLRDRWFDVGVGYFGDYYSGGSPGFYHHGFAAEATYYLETNWNPATRNRTRIGLIGSGEIVVDDFGGITDRGSGASFGVIIERVSHSSGGDSEGDPPGPLRQHVPIARGLTPFHHGGWIGETGIGLTATASLRSFPNETYGVVMLSVSFRLPLGFGIAGIRYRKYRSQSRPPPTRIIYE